MTDHTCLCKTHVRKGAIVIAIVEIILSVLFIVFNFWKGHWYLGLFPGIIEIGLCIFIIVGDIAERSWMYLPYIIISALILIGSVIWAIFCIYYVVKLPTHIRNDFDHSIEARAYYIGAFIIDLIFIIVYAYLWSVVLRAYKYIRDEVECRSATQPNHIPMDIRGAPQQQPQTAAYPQAVNQPNPPPQVYPHAVYPPQQLYPPPQLPSNAQIPIYDQQSAYGHQQINNNPPLPFHQNNFGQHYDMPPAYQSSGKENLGFN